MKRHPIALALGGVAVVGAAAAISGAATSASGEGTIQACRHLRHGLVRIVADPSACKLKEIPISWNEQGPPGEKGEKGDPGPVGPQGPKGDPGPAGLASLSALEGTDCTTHDGASGRVEIEVTPTDLIMLSCGTGAVPTPTGAKIVINELDYDQVGADAGGFLEIRNNGNEAAALDGIAIVLVNGDGTEYGRKSLTGSLGPGAHLAVELDPQNGAPDGVALFDTAGKAVLDALSYEGAITSANIDGQTYNLVEGTALAATVADSNDEPGSLIRNPDGKDTNDAASDWAFTTTVTPGAANTLTP